MVTNETFKKGDKIWWRYERQIGRNRVTRHKLGVFIRYINARTNLHRPQKAVVKLDDNKTTSTVYVMDLSPFMETTRNKDEDDQS